MKRAFIENDFPLNNVSNFSALEKKSRKSTVVGLHTYWARRPLASSRATMYASLISASENEEERKEQNLFISKLADPENINDSRLIEQARKNILNNNSGKTPIVVDPFSGGGSIPMEAMRLGCSTYASDLNPLAVLIGRATLEFPQKYGVFTLNSAEHVSTSL